MSDNDLFSTNYYDDMTKGMRHFRLDITNYLKLCKEKVMNDTNLLSG